MRTNRNLGTEILSGIKEFKYQEYNELILKYPEMLDFFKVIIKGREKYPDENWLTKDGSSMSRKDNGSSLFRHTASYYSGEIHDSDSKLDHRLHIACRALMSYVRDQRQINHPKDINQEVKNETN